MALGARTPLPIARVVLLGVSLLACSAHPPPGSTTPGGAPETPQTAAVPEPTPTASAPGPVDSPKPDFVRVGAGESAVVAPGQIVQGGWFRLAVFGDKSCGASLGGGTLHAIDLFYDNLTPYPTRFFSPSARVEIVNARGESFPVVGGLIPGEVCGPAIALGEGARPGARLRGWPFAGLPRAAEPPTQVRLVLEEPHGFAVSTVVVDLGLPAIPAGPLPARSQAMDAATAGGGAVEASSPYFEVAGEGLRACTKEHDPWIDRVLAEGKTRGQSLRLVGLELRLVNRSREAISITSVEVVDANGHGYSVYPPTNTSCESGRFPEQVDPQLTGRGTAGFAIVPAGTPGLALRAEVRPVGKSHYDGYKPVTVRIPLGGVGR